VPLRKCWQSTMSCPFSIPSSQMQ